jgi:hypothetical protein
LQPGDRLTPRFLARFVQQLIACLLEFLCRRGDRGGIGDVELDAYLWYRPVRRPLAGSEARLRRLGQRPDPEGFAAGDLLAVVIAVALALQLVSRGVV